MTKPFTWSYSPLKNFETCPKRHLHYDILKEVGRTDTPELMEGKRLHSAMEARLRSGTPLPLGTGQYERYAAALRAMPGALYVETKLAITEQLQPTAYFAPNAWFRTVVDAAVIDDGVARIIDWKTGKPKEDETQLQLMTVAMFIHDPSVMRVKASLVFLAHNDVHKEEYVREDVTEIWAGVLPRVAAMKRAKAEQSYPPKPSGLCKKYCEVVSCPHHGR